MGPTTSSSRRSRISGVSRAPAVSGSPQANSGNDDPVSSGATEKPARESTDHIRKLVDRAQKGDRSALEELYLIHFDRIYSYLHVSVGNRQDRGRDQVAPAPRTCVTAEAARAEGLRDGARSRNRGAAELRKVHAVRGAHRRSRERRGRDGGDPGSAPAAARRRGTGPEGDA